MKWALFWIALLALAVLAFAQAVKATRARAEKARITCTNQGGEMIDYGRYRLCRMPAPEARS